MTELIIISLPGLERVLHLQVANLVATFFDNGFQNDFFLCEAPIDAPRYVKGIDHIPHCNHLAQPCMSVVEELGANIELLEKLILNPDKISNMDSTILMPFTECHESSTNSMVSSANCRCDILAEDPI